MPKSKFKTPKFKLPKGATLAEPSMSREELIMGLTSKMPEDYDDLDTIKKQGIETILTNLNNGFGIKESCKVAGVSHITLYRYRRRYAWIQEAMETINAAKLQIVEDALFKSATGYDYETVDQMMEDVVDSAGNSTGGQKRRQHKKTVHVPMSPTSAIFFLKNRSRGEWRNDNALEITSSHTERHEVAIAADVRHLVQHASNDDLRILAQMGDRLKSEVEARQVSDEAPVDDSSAE